MDQTAISGAIAAVVVTLARLLKEDVKFLPNVPSAWRGVLVAVLSYLGGALQAVASGEPLSAAMPHGLAILALAASGYAVLRLASPKAAGARTGLEAMLLEMAKQRQEAEAMMPRPQMPPEASDASAPRTPRSGTVPGGPSLLLVLAAGALIVLHQLACTPQQLAGLKAGVQLLGTVCDVVSDVSGRDEVEYACDAIDAAAPMVSLIPTASASAPPPGAKAGPPMPAAPPAPAKRQKVVVPRAEQAAFERSNRVRGK